MWTLTEDEKTGVAIFRFQSCLPHALKLDLGESVGILEKCQGWFRGFSCKRTDVKGIFPCSYIHVMKYGLSSDGYHHPDEIQIKLNGTATPVEDALVAEVTSTLREWAPLWKQLYVKRKVEVFFQMAHVMSELMELRKQLVTARLADRDKRDIKRHVATRLDWGNEHLGLDLVPRKDFETVDEDKVSVSDLYKIHLGSRNDVRHGSQRHDSVQPCRAPVVHHLLLNMKTSTCNSIGEDSDIFFWLYDSREAKSISEKFMVRLNKNGEPKKSREVDGLCALFTDLSNEDLKRDLYIVSQVIRSGRMLLNEHRKGLRHGQYRRPYGCAVLAMSNILQTIAELKEEKDFVLKVYMCNNESEWYQIHENIIRKCSSKYSAPANNSGLVISLQLLHGDVEALRRENKWLSRASVTHKLGFPDVMVPGDVRNDFYLTLERGDFERGGKSVQKNIEVTVSVLLDDGELVQDCIGKACGQPNRTQHRSVVLYHNNSPRWNEAVKLGVPLDRFQGTHLRFDFRHCSTKDKGEKKLFAFSFTPLMREDGSTLSDQSHQLYVYKVATRILSFVCSQLSLLSRPQCDESGDLRQPGLYLVLPCCQDGSSPGLPAASAFQRSARETFWISTQLSSTKLTQNANLLALLKWKAHPDRVGNILGRLRHVTGEEIVKFLQDILDTLFAILDDDAHKYGPLVFQSLVFVINLLGDSKYFHFRAVMDTYIHKHFAGALAYKELIRCLRWVMESLPEAVWQDHTQDVMRALEYLFKFIIQSRSLYSGATCGMEEEQFRSSFQELFESIHFVLGLDWPTCESLIMIQVAALRSFTAIFDELLHIFSVQEVAEFVRSTLASFPSVLATVGHSMDVVRLQSITRTVDSSLFALPESRRILLPLVLHHIHLHLRHQKELPTCSGILTSLFSIIKASSLDASVQEEVELMVESLLDVLLQTLLSIMSSGQSQEAGEFVSCLLSLLRHMTDVHFQHLMENFQSKEVLKEFMMKIWCVLRNLMKLSIFPRDWTVMRLLSSHIILRTVQRLAPYQLENFVGDDFDFKVWSAYFSLAVLYINQPSLQLESMSAAKRKKIFDKYGDMRVTMAYELFSMWQNLSENKRHLIPGMIGPFLGVTLVPQAEIRNIMVPIFHDMMDWEQRKEGSLKQVEAELIDKLDALVSEGKGDDDYRELLSLLTLLLEPYPSLLEKIEQQTWRETGTSLVTSVTRLMERLLDYRDGMRGDETESKSTGCTVNLLTFYKSELNKEEMYIRYIHKLCDLHVGAGNYTEAAFTLLLYWELLHWDERPTKELLRYPSQSEWQRKEALSRKLIHYFAKGKCWEFGIPLCRELAFQYESLYDYQSLSWIRVSMTKPFHTPVASVMSPHNSERTARALISSAVISLAAQKLEAAYFDDIMEQQRLEPKFFRVGFYGRMFPFFLRNKEFVCRGHDYERLEAFQQRMLAEFPQAIAVRHPNQPDEAILQSNSQYLQIYAVTPVPEAAGILRSHRVPDRIKSFYRVNNVHRFRHDRPFHKGPKDPDNEFKSLWIERTTLVLAHPLPGISPWFEVEEQELVEVSPLENAVSVVENKNQELRSLISRYHLMRPHGVDNVAGDDVNLLSMTLNGVVDAAVNGGIARYQEAFFGEDYIGSHPQDGDKISQLKDLMQEQLEVLGAGLAVHGRLVHPEMRPLHKKLMDRFQVIRSSLCRAPCAASQANTAGGIAGPEGFTVHRHSEAANGGNVPIPADGQDLDGIQRVFLQQLMSPAWKPCSDPYLSSSDKVVTVVASSWSLDCVTRKVIPVLSAHVGAAPPVPPRNTQAHASCLSVTPPLSPPPVDDAFHHQLGDLLLLSLCAPEQSYSASHFSHQPLLLIPSGMH
ncbi:dedicator of cytokinesis protein 3 isoform X3 [Syngnathus scovelli]|uniref:dedicator of cytokinesis protein 3 isoform X3 n=1 Tax=Syngnathus scovelli TaxID=161590 RepID=UPI00211083BA|nr:dedicator of cytokinesis protein 3 isoform X3 [Syngnathus scovelli]